MSSPLDCLVAMRHRLMWWEPFFFGSDSGPSSSSFCLLYLVLLFWNQTFTWRRDTKAEEESPKQEERRAFLWGCRGSPALPSKEAQWDGGI